jgi:hypothetical protein
MPMGYSIESIQHAFDLYALRTKRGKVIKAGLNAYDSCLDGIYVVCGKHPNLSIAVDVIGMNSMKSVSDLLDEAFDRCPGCMEEASWSKSRFPEDAEL